MKNFVYLLLVISTTVYAQQWTGAAGLTGTINRQGKVILNSTTWNDHLEISRSGYGALFQPDYSSGFQGLGLKLISGNFYVLNGNTGIGIASPTSRLHIAEGAGGEQLRISRGTGAVRFFQDPDKDNLYLGDHNGAPYMSWRENGFVGVGTFYPSARLHIESTVSVLPTDQINVVEISATATANNAGAKHGIRFSVPQGGGLTKTTEIYNVSESTYNNRNGLAFHTAQQERVRITHDGNVGIGTSTPGSFKLAVEGKIYGKEVQVALTNPGPDYVFEKDYALPTLESVKTYIDQNKRLPEVPSAKEMEANGINLSEMNMLLLKKVEELTLYVIDQQKEIEVLKSKIK